MNQDVQPFVQLLHQHILYVQMLVILVVLLVQEISLFR
jgi:hypothetical protein